MSPNQHVNLDEKVEFFHNKQQQMAEPPYKKQKLNWHDVIKNYQWSTSNPKLLTCTQDAQQVFDAMLANPSELKKNALPLLYYELQNSQFAAPSGLDQYLINNICAWGCKLLFDMGRKSKVDYLPILFAKHGHDNEKLKIIILAIPHVAAAAMEQYFEVFDAAVRRDLTFKYVLGNVLPQKVMGLLDAKILKHYVTQWYELILNAKQYAVLADWARFSLHFIERYTTTAQYVVLFDILALVAPYVGFAPTSVMQQFVHCIDLHKEEILQHEWIAQLVAKSLFYCYPDPDKHAYIDEQFALFKNVPFDTNVETLHKLYNDDGEESTIELESLELKEFHLLMQNFVTKAISDRANMRHMGRGLCFANLDDETACSMLVFVQNIHTFPLQLKLGLAKAQWPPSSDLSDLYAKVQSWIVTEPLDCNVTRELLYV